MAKNFVTKLFVSSPLLLTACLATMAPGVAKAVVTDASAASAVPEVTLDTSATLDTTIPVASDDVTVSQPIQVADQSVSGTTSVSDLMAETKSDSVGQVTSVSQLRDVFPTDWAFQAVQSLVERYGCIAGYPNGTFRGNNKATRYELAAALNACLDQISDRFASKADVDMAKALQAEFAAELATLRGRVDGLEARVATVEAQQFSTTTKLSGTAVFLGQFGDSSSPFDISDDGPNVGVDQLGDSRASVISTVYLSFNTSFSGEDLLETTLFFGNGGTDIFSAAGVGGTPSQPFDGGAGIPFFNPGQNFFAGASDVLLYRLAYTFKPTKDLSIMVSPLFFPTDIIDVNSYTSPFTGHSTWFLVNNPLITPYIFNFFGGAGGAIVFNPGEGPFTARAVYQAANGSSPVDGGTFGTNVNGGLFGDPYQLTGELEYADDFGDKNNFAIRLQYTNSASNNISQNAFGVNAELTLGKFGIFGRYAFSDADANGVVNPFPFSPGFAGDFEAQTFQAGLAYSDLFVPGSQFGVSVGAPFIVSDSDVPGGGVGPVNDATQLNAEAYYRFPVSDNITISPIFSAIFNPNNSNFSGDLYQGLIRVVFSF